MLHKFKEGKAAFFASKGKITAGMQAFYNPVMRLNRDFSVMAVRAYGKVHFADILAGTGVRGIRLLKETDNILSLSMNDSNPGFKQLAKRNFKLNRLGGEAELHDEDANIFLLKSKGFSAIDIDPFGSPNPFLDAAISRMARKGLLFLTSTDTASLSGTYPKTCQRKYWAQPLRNHLMHEVGLRILIRRVQLVGADKERSMRPLFSYFRDHYFRICFLCEKGRQKADSMIRQHSSLSYNDHELTAKENGSVGPAWTGQLHDNQFLSLMIKQSEDMPADTQEFLRLLEHESRIDSIGFYDMHAMAKGKRGKVLKVDDVLGKLKKKKISASRSQFCPWGIKSTRWPF
ncbi:MAG: hypothetical protein KJ709_01520 [Nanoarchaeota archaeon]|nr:hypothetical protein [Nanoarchaeota archaeon]